MARHIKTFYLFNPIRMTKQEVTYEEAMKFTGLDRGTMGSMKTRKKFIASSGVYFLNTDITVGELRKFVANTVIKDEVWKKIEGFEDYQISTYGRIKSYLKGKETFLLPSVGRARRLSIRLKKDGKVYSFLVHRLVAEAFLHKPKHKDYQVRVLKNLDNVGHKDMDPFNNEASNLTWISKHDLHRVKKKKTVEVVRIDPLTKERTVYDSIKDAAEELFISTKAVGNCSRGISATCAGFVWIRKEDEDKLALI